MEPGLGLGLEVEPLRYLVGHLDLVPLQQHLGRDRGRIRDRVRDRVGEGLGVGVGVGVRGSI